jgi:hypothetical protein
MYPRGELKRLALRKELLQARIAVRRLECQLHAARLAEPLRWGDRALAVWRRISPALKAVGMPLGILLGRKLAHRVGGRFAWLARFAPMAVQAAQAVAQARAGGRRPA